MCRLYLDFTGHGLKDSVQRETFLSLYVLLALTNGSGTHVVTHSAMFNINYIDNTDSRITEVELSSNIVYSDHNTEMQLRSVWSGAWSIG